VSERKKKDEFEKNNVRKVGLVKYTTRSVKEWHVLQARLDGMR
jgi:hypothetical protein